MVLVLQPTEPLHGRNLLPTITPARNAAIAIKKHADPFMQYSFPCFSLLSVLGVVQQTAGKHHALAALGKLALHLEAEALCLVLNDDLSAVFNDRADIRDSKLIALLNLVVIGFVHEFQRQNAVVDEVLAVNSRKALADDSLNAEVQRSKSRVLS